MLYFIQFDQPLGNPSKRHGTAQYYLGYCEDGRLDDRLAEHRAGRGAAITAAAVRNGIKFRVVLTLPGDRNEERRLKNQKNHRRIIERERRRQANDL